MRRAILLAGLVVLSACATTQATRGPERTTVEATVPASDALARVQAAMVAEGLTVTSAQGGVVVGEATDNLLKVRYNANVIAAGDSARVVLTAHGIRTAAFGMPEVSAQVKSNMGGPAGEAWARLERIAAALTAAGGSNP